MKKFVNIEIKGESNNIAVIDLGVIDHKDGNEKNSRLIKDTLEPKLVQALSEHFDCEVRIIRTNVVSVIPLEIEVDLILGLLEEDRQEKVVLKETWIY